MAVTIKLTREQWEQSRVDIENAIEEFTTLSRDVEYYVTDMDERLERVLQWLEEGQLP
jgi:hypothetical protein